MNEGRYTVYTVFFNWFLLLFFHEMDILYGLTADWFDSIL